LLIFSTSIGCSLGAGSTGTLFGPQDAETPVTRTRLAERPPTIHQLQFSAGDQPGHVKPKTAASAGSTAPVRKASAPTALPAEQVGPLRRVAETNSRVTAMLGEHWAFIEADRLAPDGKMTFGCCMESSRPVKLLYFSYSHNVAVAVLVQESTVISVSRQEGYIPPEGDEDVHKAVELAKSDSRLSAKASGLTGHGIMMEPARGVIWNDPGYGHRVMWVTFSHGDDGDPKLWAIVDLTDDTVLDAGEEPPR
jgi:hypothetical protein